MFTVAGAGTGMQTAWAVHGATAGGQGAGDDAVGREPVDEHTEDGNDVRDRVDRPHLVEMHLINGDAVGGSLGIGEDAEGVERKRPSRIRQGMRAPEQRQYPRGPRGRAHGRRARGCGKDVISSTMPLGMMATVRMRALSPLPVQVCHIVIVVLVLSVQHHVEIATRDARTRHARSRSRARRPAGFPAPRAPPARRTRRPNRAGPPRAYRPPRRPRTPGTDLSLAVPHAHAPLPAI